MIFANYFKTIKLDKKFYRFTPFIARGLAYYTGPVWEFEILEGDVGSVAGCGRYDNIIGKFVGKEVEWKSPAGKVIKGKISSAHGSKGVVRAIFERGLPGQAVTMEVSIK